MRKLVYDKKSGEVSLLLQTNDPDMADQLLRLKTRETQAVIEAPGVHSVDGVAVDVKSAKPRIVAIKKQGAT